jgi:hypothetical protein
LNLYCSRVVSLQHPQNRRILRRIGAYPALNQAGADLLLKIQNVAEFSALSGFARDRNQFDSGAF